MFASKTLRTLALAAALMSPVLAGSAFADGHYVAGPSAVGSWTQADSRTPLASNRATQGSNQTSLEKSGATGGGGQHS
jgi:hypothetical protein